MGTIESETLRIIRIKLAYYTWQRLRATYYGKGKQVGFDSLEQIRFKTGKSVKNVVLRDRWSEI